MIKFNRRSQEVFFMIRVKKLEKGTYFDDAYMLSFRYDPSTVAKVKELAQRRYLPEERAWEIPSYTVAEDENYYAFLDINPLAEGHTLVVPKKEVDYIFDLDDETLAGLTRFAKKVAHRIKSKIECKKVAMVVLGLEVPHAHIHLIPMNSENDVDFKREKLRFTPEEFRKTAAILAE